MFFFQLHASPVYTCPYRGTAMTEMVGKGGRGGGGNTPVEQVIVLKTTDSTYLAAEKG